MSYEYFFLIWTKLCHYLGVTKTKKTIFCKSKSKNCEQYTSFKIVYVKIHFYLKCLSVLNKFTVNLFKLQNWSLVWN